DPARERGDREQRQGDESGSGSRQGVMAGIAVPNHALIVCTTFFAMRRCAAVLGCTPSHENANPKGEPVQATLVFGNGATWPGTARTESSVGFTSQKPKSALSAFAWARMYALYAVTVAASLANSEVQTVQTAEPARLTATLTSDS